MKKYLLSIVLVLSIVLCGCSEESTDPTQTVKTTEISSTVEFNEIGGSVVSRLLCHSELSEESILVHKIDCHVATLLAMTA